jgi:tetratricopeptide (TPR) repeat protein
MTEPNESSEPVAYAEALYGLGLLDKCLEFCELNAGKGEATPKLLRLKALCLIGLGRAAEARKLLADPLMSATADAAAHAGLAAAFEARGDDDQALSLYDEALRLSPKDPGVLISRACLKQKLGRHDAALADLDAAIELSPGQPDHFLVRVVFLYDAGRSAEGEKYARRVMEGWPVLQRALETIMFYGAPIMRLRRAEALWTEGRMEDALRACDEVLGDDPLSAAALTIKGFCLMTSGNLPEARKALDEAVRLAPDAALPYKRLGMVQQRQGDLAGARASYERALELEPGDGESLFGRAEAKLAQSDRAGALADLRAASADAEWRQVSERAIRDAGLA